MYKAKASKQPMVIFDESLHLQNTEDFHFSIGLKQAFSQQTLKVFYQPIVKSSNADVYGRRSALSLASIKMAQLSCLSDLLIVLKIVI